MSTPVLKAFLCAILLVATSHVGRAQVETYVQIVAPADALSQIIRLPSYDPHAVWIDRNGLHALLSTTDALRLTQEETTAIIEIADVQRHYSERALIEMKSLEDGSRQALSSADPEHFRFGSVGGHYSLDEIYDELSRMKSEFPTLISDTIRIGESVQGRGIYAVRIASSTADSNAPEALWISLIHAREPIGMMSAAYSMWDLLESYGTDVETTALLDHRVLWVIPVANPDGYQYNVQTNPNGGGLWRKNLGQSGQGIDLNRNFGSFEVWSQPANGGSDDPGSNTYRGTAPFSEPESQAIRDFIATHRFSSIISHHSFSNVLIVPPYAEETGIAEFDEWLFDATREINRETGFGPGTSTIAVGYPVSGSYELWAGNHVNPDGSDLYSWVPETGSDDDGFWPPPSRIISLARRLHPLNRRSIHMAGPHAALQSFTIDETDGVISARLDLINVGTRDMVDPFTLNIDGDLTLFTELPPLDAGERIHVELPLLTAPDSARIQVIVTVRSDGTISQDIWEPISSAKVILFSDDFSGGLDQWLNSDWGIQTAGDRGRVASDSPYNPYELSNEATHFQMRDVVSTVGYDRIDLSFTASAEIFAREHSLMIEARAIGGEWRRVDGRYLHVDASGYDTLHSEMRGDLTHPRRYTIPLDEFAGRDVQVRFALSAPLLFLTEVYDGVLLDDVKLTGSRNRVSGVGTIEAREEVCVLTNRSDRTIHVRGVERFDYQIHDLLGRETASEGDDVTGSIDVHELPSGIYYITIEADGEIHRLPFSIW